VGQSTVNLRGGAFALAVIASFAGFDRAHSADWPVDAPPLRGTLAPSFARWDGWQVGMEGGHSNVNVSPSFTASDSLLNRES